MARMHAPRIAGDEQILQTIENVQAVGSVLEVGDAVHITQFDGLVNAQVIEDVVSVARNVAKVSGWGVVMARAPPASLVWRNGVARAGFAQGFGGDAAEIFVCEQANAVLVQLRAGLDVV